MPKPDARNYLENLRFSIGEQLPELNQLVSLQRSYDNRINPANWPTNSEIPTAQHFTMVEEALANVWENLFPESDDVMLLPKNQTTPEQWANAEWALKTMVNHVIGMKNKTFRSLKDCFKCGVGYTIIESIFITPAESREIVTERGITRILTDGTSRRSIDARHVSPGSIIPYPSGTDFNGRDCTPMAWMLDFFPQWQLEALYEGKYGDIKLSQSLETVLTNARQLAEAGVSDLMHFHDQMSGRSTPRPQSSLLDMMPISVPIIRVFEQPGTEIWIAPRSTTEGDIILRIEVEDQQHRVPLIKWDASPDAGRWYPMSMAQADQSRGLAYDMWINFLFDMMTFTKDAVRVIDKSALPAGQDRLYPGQDIYPARGNATTAAAYLQPPPIDPQLMNVGDILNNVGRRIQGTSDVTGRNYTRGGANAFQDMLNTAQARQRLSIMILEMGAVKECYEHVFALMQDTIDAEGMELVQPVWDAGDSHVSDRRIVTGDDLRHDYAVVIDTSVRRMLGGMDSEMRFKMAERWANDPMAHPYEARRLYPVPEAIARRALRSRDEMEAIQAQEQAAAQAQQQAETQAAMPPQPEEMMQ